MQSLGALRHYDYNVAGANAYEQALQSLPPRARDAVVLRLEFELSYAEIAEELGAPSADAARLVVARALRTLAEIMPHDGATTF